MKMQSEANSKLFGFEFLLPDFLAANQGFRLCPKDTGIWIVILSKCFRFPSSVVSKVKNRGGAIQIHSMLQFVVWHNSMCHLLWRKLVGRQRRGKVH